MTRSEFTSTLGDRLSGLKKEELESTLAYYNELIDDRLESGLSEEEAVLDLGSIEEIAEHILEGTAETAKEETKEKVADEKEKKKVNTVAIVALCVGSPIWIALAAVAFSLLVALYSVIWAVIAAAWTLFGSLCAVVLAGISSGTLAVIGGSVTSLAFFGMVLVAASLALFLFIPVLKLTKLTARFSAFLAVKIFKGVKAIFVKIF